jgi:alpha-N-arabinofuranosidase
LLLQRTARSKSTIVASTKIDIKTAVQLRVKAIGDNYEFSYSANGTDFTNLGGTVSGDILSTDVAGGFTGAMIGLYATSANNAIPE